MNAIQQSIDEMEMQEWENDEDENTDTPGVTFYFNNYTESFKPPHAIVAPTPAPIENTNFSVDDLSYLILLLIILILLAILFVLYYLLILLGI